MYFRKIVAMQKVNLFYQSVSDLHMISILGEDGWVIHAKV